MKKVLGFSLVLLLVLSIFAGCTKSKDDAAKVYELKLAHHMPIGHVYSVETDWFASEVAARTNNAVKVTVYPAEQLGDEDSAWEGVLNGSIEIALAGPGVIGARYLPINILEVCYLFRDVDHLKKTLSSPIIKDFEKGLLEATSVRLLSIPYYGTRHVTTSRKAINSVDDLRNLKLRCPNEQMITTCWRAMGTSPTPMSLSEVYMALSQNAVDGQENPFPTIIAQKFYEVQRYIALTGHTVQTLPILINEKVYQNLPPEYRKVIDEVAVQCADRITQGIINAEAVQLDELKANGMTVTYPDVTPLRTAILEKVVPEYQAEWGKGLFEQIQAIR